MVKGQLIPEARSVELDFLRLVASQPSASITIDFLSSWTLFISLLISYKDAPFPLEVLLRSIHPPSGRILGRFRLPSLHLLHPFPPLADTRHNNHRMAELGRR